MADEQRTADDTHSFYILQDGVTVVTGSAPRRSDAVREAIHYAMMYSQDNPVKVVIRRIPQRKVKAYTAPTAPAEVTSLATPVGATSYGSGGHKRWDGKYWQDVGE